MGRKSFSCKKSVIFLKIFFCHRSFLANPLFQLFLQYCPFIIFILIPDAVQYAAVNSLLQQFLTNLQHTPAESSVLHLNIKLNGKKILFLQKIRNISENFLLSPVLSGESAFPAVPSILPVHHIHTDPRCGPVCCCQFPSAAVPDESAAYSC